MRIPFRQGIVEAPPNFITPTGSVVTLSIAPRAIVTVAFADGMSNYLYTERQTINAAWSGPFASGTNYWLYWDIDRRTGLRSFGHTLLAPVAESTAPIAPQNDQHWFDTTVNKMKVWNSTTNAWVVRIRLFAAMLQGGTIPISMSIHSPVYTGTQIGSLDNIETFAGALVFDRNGDPIKRSNGTFFTTEDAVTTGISSAVEVKLGAVLIEAIAAEPIPAFSVVRFSDFHEIQLATQIDITGAYGLIERDVDAGDTVNVTSEGVITNPAWDWSSVGVNTSLYVDDQGQLTSMVQPLGVVVAQVVDHNTVILRPVITTYGAQLADSVLELLNNDVSSQTEVTKINFVGSIVSVVPTNPGEADVVFQLPPVKTVTVQDDGVDVDPDIDTINFGTGLTVTPGVTGTVNIAGNVYTAGTRISIVGNQISATLASAGAAGAVQLGDGTGGFTAVAGQPAGMILTSTGTGSAPTWQNPATSGTVTSVSGSGGTTGLTLTGGPITSTGTLTLGGTLAVANGGTGGTTPAQAQQNLLPTQVGSTSGAALTTNGSGVLAWVVPPDTTYTPGTAITITSGVISSTVADNTGLANRVPLTNGNGTLATLPAGTSGQVLTSFGAAAPQWQAIPSQLPTQTGNAGLFLTTNGTSVNWAAVPAGTVTSVGINPGTTGLTVLNSPVTSSGNITLGGVLAVSHGGTGGNTATQGLNNLLPTQTGNTGRILSTNGTDTSWIVMNPGTVTSVAVSGGTTGLSTSGGPVTSNGTITLTGTLAVAHGGTGGTTPTTALTNLLPAQSGATTSQVLMSNGTTAAWASTAVGSVTSVAVSGGTTGLTTSGGPVTSAGTITLGGTLAVANGGTGGTTPAAALNNLLPTQATQTGKVLTTDGSTATWQDAAGSNAVLLTGDQTVAGVKTFSNDLNSSATITAVSFSGAGTGLTGTAAGLSIGGSAATLTTARTINGTSFNGSANITTTNWGTARTITIGSTGKSVNGSAAVSWTLTEIGAPSLTGAGASGAWGISVTGSAATLTTPRTINGTSFDGSANVTTAEWGTSRTVTIGTTGKAVNGSANVSWSLAEIGAEGTVAAATTDDYYRGDKSWQSFAAAVRSAVLTGLTTATNVAVTAADSVLVAIGKLQAQINAAAKLAVAQTFTASQRGTVTVQNTLVLPFDLNVTNNFSCSLITGGGTLTFTNLAAGQSGFILFTNPANFTISAAATTKTSATFLSQISVTGTYLLSYFSDGTNVYVVTSEVFV